MSKTLELGKDVLIYAVGTLAQRAVIFFLLPVYTRVLSVSEYGLLETVTVTSQVVLFIMDVGMSRSVLRYYARYRDDPKALGTLFTTGLSLMVLSSIVILVVGVLFRKLLASLLFGDATLTEIVTWLLIASLFQTLNQWIFTLFRANRQSVSYVVLSIINLIALTVLNVIFVRHMHLGVMGVLWAQTIVYLIIAVFFFPRILRVAWRNREFSWVMIQQLLKFGLPLIFTMSGMLIINTVDRYFLVHYRGLEDVGIYSLGVRISALLTIAIVAPFQLAWGPFLFWKEKEDIRKLASQVFTYLVFALVLSGSLFLFFSRELIMLFSSPEFFEAQKIIPYMLLSVALTGIYYWAGGLVNLVEKTWLLGLIVSFSGLCNIALNYFFTPAWGWTGAAWANVLSKSIAAIATLGFGINYLPIRFEIKRLVRLGGILAGLYVTYSLALMSLGGVSALILKMLVLILGLIFLWGPLQFFTKRERQELFGWLMTFRARIF